MRHSRRGLWLALAVLLTLPAPALAQGVGAGAAPAPTLPATVSAALAKAKLEPTVFSAAVVPLQDSQVRFSLRHRASEPMAPASTLKVLTTAVALDELGPTYRWRTEVLTDAALGSSTLRGALYLRGGGEPNLGWPQLQGLMRDLRAQGIRHLRGDLVLDRGRFEPARPDVGLPPFDESPDAYYNVIPDTLLVHNNLLSVRLHSDGVGVQATLLTPLHGVRVHSTLTLNDLPCSDWDEQWQIPQVKTSRNGQVLLVLRGQFPRQCQVDAATNVLDRNLFIERLWRALWSELGGTWQGRVRDGNTPPDAKPLTQHTSETLADIAKTVNKRSDNTMARILLLTLGAEHPQRHDFADDFAAARTRIEAWMRARGIPTEGAVLDNGSGLSRLERLSAEQLALTLRAAWRSPWYPEIAVGLPIVGVDGAMRRRLADTPARQASRIKTGSLRDTATVAGYVRDGSGQSCAVVAMVNHPQARLGRPALDALIEHVARSPGGCGTMTVSP